MGSCVELRATILLEKQLVMVWLEEEVAVLCLIMMVEGFQQEKVMHGSFKELVGVYLLGYHTQLRQLK